MIPRAHWPSDVSTNAIKRWPREPAGTIGIVARAAGAGAVLIGFAIGSNSVHDGSLTLAAVSASRGPVVTDKCTDNPADPTCPPPTPRRSSLRRETKDTNLRLRRITTSLGRHPGPTTPAQGVRRLGPIIRDRANHHLVRIIRNPARLTRRHMGRKRRRPSHPLDRRKPLRLRTHPMSRRRQFRLPSHRHRLFRRRSWRRLRSLPLHRHR